MTIEPRCELCDKAQAMYSPGAGAMQLTCLRDPERAVIVSRWGVCDEFDRDPGSEGDAKR